MIPTEAPTVDALLSMGTLVLLIMALTEVIIRAVRPSEDQKDRFGPLLAIGLGIVIAVLVGINQSVDLAQAIVTGLFAGLSSMGLYKVVKTGYEAAGGG